MKMEPQVKALNLGWLRAEPNEATLKSRRAARATNANEANLYESSITDLSTASREAANVEVKCMVV
jgi:hypothetical protein